MALLGEMRRRNVFKVSLAYALVSWLVVQLAGLILPAFAAPQSVMQFLVLGLILLFPIVVLLAWAYELTPTGFVPTADVDRSQSITVKTGQTLNRIVFVLLSLAVVFMVVDNYLIDEEIVIDPDFAYRQAIVVLPFDDISESADNARPLVDGIHDDLLNRLAKVSDLSVVALTSAQAYRDTTATTSEIGEALGVGSVIEGSVQRSDDSVRISVQLIDARTDENIWADTFNRELNASNVFEIQAEIAAAVAEALEADVSAVELRRISTVSTESLPALDAYYAAKWKLDKRTRDDLISALNDLERAVDFDAEFAAAWAAMAQGWLELPYYDLTHDPQRVRRQASSAVIRAVTLDPESADAHAALGWHLLLHNYDWRGAEDAFRQALLIEANHVGALQWYSHLLSWQGQHDEAIRAARLAVDADPLSLKAQTVLNYVLLDAARWEDAAEVAERIVASGGHPSLYANNWIGMLRARQAEEAAVALVQWAMAIGGDVEAAREMGELIIRSMAYGEEVEVSTALIERLQIENHLADIHAALGDADNTLAALAHAHQTGIGAHALLAMRINPSFDFVRDEPAFGELLEQVGLSE